MSNEVTTISNPYGAAIAPIGHNNSMAVSVAREVQEVQAMVFMAKQFPRDERQAAERILSACKREQLAKDGLYSYPRGGTRVEGPSIRLAETLVRYWGNADYGTRILEAGNKSCKVEAFCWDIETNVRSRKVFDVSLIRHTNSGDYLLTDPRDIYEEVANKGARRVRNCILAILPADVVDAAVAQCKKTQEDAIKNGKETIEERTEKMLTLFAEYKVTKEMIEAYIGCNLSAITPDWLRKLANVLKSLQDGMASVETHFGGAMARAQKKTIAPAAKALDEVPMP